MTFELEQLQRLSPIGYLAKRTKKCLDHTLGSVEEICSVSCCLSKAPPGARELWRHNTMSLYASEALALGVIPAEQDREAYDFYAYFMPPVAFDDGAPRDLNQDERNALSGATTDVEPVGSDYLLLGWDIVTNWVGWADGQAFECSPLTCNGLAKEITTNRYGLIDGLERAFALVQYHASTLSAHALSGSLPVRRRVPGTEFELSLKRTCNSE